MLGTYAVSDGTALKHHQSWSTAVFHGSVSKLPQSIYLELKGVLCPSRSCPTAVLRFKQKVPSYHTYFLLNETTGFPRVVSNSREACPVHFRVVPVFMVFCGTSH